MAAAETLGVSQVVGDGPGFGVRDMFQLERRAAIPERADSWRGPREVVDEDVPVVAEGDPGPTKPSPRTLAAYRADVEGVARRIDTDGPGCSASTPDQTGPASRPRLLGR